MDSKKIGIMVVAMLFSLVVMTLTNPADQIDYPLLVAAGLGAIVFMIGLDFLVNRFAIIQKIISWFYFILIFLFVIGGTIATISFIPEDPTMIFIVLLFIAGCFFMGLHKVPWIIWGNFLFNRGWYGVAESHYSNLIRMNPKIVVGYDQRALMRIKQDKFDDALSDLNRAVELARQEVRQPVSPSEVIINKSSYLHILNARGNFYLMIGNPDEAFKDFNMILTELDLDNIDPPVISVVHLNRGISRLHSGNYDEALPDLEQAKVGLANQPALNMALFNLALTYQALGRVDEARGHWREAVEKDTNVKDRGWLEKERSHFPEPVWALWEQLAR